MPPRLVSVQCRLSRGVTRLLRRCRDPRLGGRWLAVADITGEKEVGLARSASGGARRLALVAWKRGYPMPSSPIPGCSTWSRRVR